MEFEHVVWLHIHVVQCKESTQYGDSLVIASTTTTGKNMYGDLF